MARGDFNSLGSVSYTHLDVYKRQIENLARVVFAREVNGVLQALSLIHI